MAASLGTTTYTSTTWTSGDIITEAKLDAMVANDQAYDSHGAEGILLNNNTSFAGKNAAATVNENLIKVDASDNIQVGEDNVGGHTVINAGTSKLVKLKVLRQDDTSDTYAKDQVVLTGWGWKLGNGTIDMYEAVTFGITFSERPVVVITTLGVKNSDPAHIGDTYWNGYGNDMVWNIAPTDIATTGFNAVMRKEYGQTFNASYRYMYSWIAIGTL